MAVIIVSWVLSAGGMGVIFLFGEESVEEANLAMPDMGSSQDTRIFTNDFTR
jgi:hypothetical protein